MATTASGKRGTNRKPQHQPSQGAPDQRRDKLRGEPCWHAHLTGWSNGEASAPERDVS